MWSTPRRLALIARDLPAVTQAAREEVKGPRVGAPEQAIAGFLRKTGLTLADLTSRDGAYFAVTERAGRPLAEVLAEAVPAIIRTFAWPKSMRWGEASRSTEALRWVRPLQGIVALLGDDVVPLRIAGIASGAATLGHRFHHPGVITIGSAHDYVEKLRACHVIVDHAERAGVIRDGARAAAAEAGLALIEDEGLVVENAGLTEWPVPLLGRFDAAFLTVPPEVIQLTARTNQKYFTCRTADGALADAFVCTANIAASDGGAGVVAGNRKVLAARLADARFFWEQDQRKTLAQHAEGLARVTFHEKLGTVADKAQRVAKLARWLVEQGIVGASPLPFRGGAGGGRAPERAGYDDSPHPNPFPKEEGLARAHLADLAEQAALLCKADLTTAMVGEFTELQGLMGGYYARAEGLPDEVADAIRDHYKPMGQGDDVPTAPVTVAVALADKLDTLARFFAIGLLPTGSKDPFALRRAAIGFLSLVLGNAIRRPFRELLLETGAASGFPMLEAFLIDRLKVQQREAGVRHDLIDAVFALGGGDDLARLLARVHALQAFIETPEGGNLHAAYKRAANILKKEDFAAPLPLAGRAGGGPLASGGSSQAEMHTPAPSRLLEGQEIREPAETALISALAVAAPRAAAAIAAEDFTAAMAALASLRAPIDAFFDQVTVNDANPATRTARLALLAQFRDAVHQVADFSKIEG